VGPRYGRLYANAVLRPLAEQVTDALGVARGQAACDVLCDSGTMGVALGAAVGHEGHVMLVDSDAALLPAAANEVSATGCAVSTRVADATALDGHRYDRVASLCTFGFWDGASLLEVAYGLMRPGGHAAVLTWDAASPPAHEAALADALREVAGLQSPFIRRCLAGPSATQAPGWEPVTLHDVVRFDGINAYWAAMVLERPVARELEPHPSDSAEALRAECLRLLQPWTAPDGTMRIPVRATLWCSPPGGRA
jgi:SAM-dependent methyltransferase